MKSIKTEIGNPYDKVNIDDMQEIFNNVLDYKFLTTVQHSEVPDEPMVMSARFYHMFDEDKYPSYKDFLKGQLDLYSIGTELKIFSSSTSKLLSRRL